MTKEDVSVVLVNLGTPKSTSAFHVASYLNALLSDPDVLTVPWLWRKCLLYGFILPARIKKVKKAYEMIWTDEGSPLQVHSESLVKKIHMLLPNHYRVYLAMRHGTPHLHLVLRHIMTHHAHSKILIVPLFPQHAEATTGSVVRATDRILSPVRKKYFVLPAFYRAPEYIQSVASCIKRAQGDYQPDCIVMSYHGIPESAMIQSGLCTPSCDRVRSCPTENNRCYRAQCFSTTRALAEALVLTEGSYCTTFQSRLGRKPWAGPDTVSILPKLFAQGVRRLLLVCPSFVSDCLETLEEIGLRLKEEWHALGGTDFECVPCVNSDAEWVTGLGAMIQNFDVSTRD